MASQTYNFTHADNSNFTTRVVLSDGALGKVNYNITFRRSSTAWTSFNLNTGTTTRPFLDMNILGTAVSTPWTFDFRNPTFTVTSLRLTSGSATARIDGALNGAAIGDTVVNGTTGITNGTTISNITSSSSAAFIILSSPATSSGTRNVTFFRQNTSLSTGVASGTIDVAAGVSASLSGSNNARTTIGAATASGSFTPTAPPPVPAPGSPSNVVIDQTGINNLRLNWDASTGTVSRYRVYLDGVSQGTTTSTVYDFTGLSGSTTYTLGVRAEGPDNNSAIVSRSGTTLPDTFTTPNVVGQTNTTAVTNLTNAGFGSVTQTTTTTGATSVNNRTVRTQSPTSGTTATTGDTATIEIFSFQRTVPDIAGLTKAQAESQLTASGFNNFSSSLVVAGSTLANNKLVRTQSVAAGTSANVLDLITFTINDYRIAIPQVVGLVRETAVATLNSAGFTNVTITTTETGATPINNNSVFSQTPVNSATT
jgi:hypothetical protein